MGNPGQESFITELRKYVNTDDEDLMKQVYEINPELERVVKSGRSLNLNDLFEEAYKNFNSSTFKKMLASISKEAMKREEDARFEKVLTESKNPKETHVKSKKRVSLEEKDKQMAGNLKDMKLGTYTYLEGIKRLHRLKVTLEKERIKRGRIDYLPQAYEQFLKLQKEVEIKRAGYVGGLDNKQKKELKKLELKQRKEERSYQKITVERLQRDMFKFAKYNKRLKDLEDQKRDIDKRFDKINIDVATKRIEEIDNEKMRIVSEINKLNPESMKKQKDILIKQNALRVEILGPKMIEQMDERVPSNVKAMEDELSAKTKRQMYILKREDSYTAKRLREDIIEREKNRDDLVKKYKEDKALKPEEREHLRKQILQESVRIEADKEIASNFEKDVTDPIELKEISDKRDEMVKDIEHEEVKTSPKQKLEKTSSRREKEKEDNIVELLGGVEIMTGDLSTKEPLKKLAAMELTKVALDLDEKVIDTGDKADAEKYVAVNKKLDEKELEKEIKDIEKGI